MELVYLWVEKYKNIKGEGFNFSPRFKCEYDEDTKELEIVDKDETGEFYPKNFFGDNINITAIVGENGSGKSSILDVFSKEEGYFLVYFENGINLYKTNLSVDLKREYSRINNNPFFRRALYYSLDYKYKDFFTRITEKSTNELIINNYVDRKKVSYPLFNFDPVNISYRFTFNAIAEYEENVTLGINENTSIKKLSKFLENEDNEYAYYLIYILNKFNQNSFINFINNKTYQNVNFYKNIQKEIDKYNRFYFKKEVFDKVRNYENKSIEIKDLNTTFNESYENIFFDNHFDFFEFDFFSDNGANYSSLSHGERIIYSLYIHLDLKEEFFLFLDEPDNTLHPNWQRKLINELIKTNKKRYIIISTHSPFILSDIPKENVVFLEEGKQVYPFKNGQTFGANIHTLLSHGFFMKNGLMGEFAKDRIDTAIKYLNQTKLSDDEMSYCENIISIIGEPIIKRQLQSMLDSKRLSEVDVIKKQIAELQFQLQLVKKEKNND